MATAIHKVLIANRGEIARRVMRTCRRLGISTVAVFSDADEAAPFVREADEAVRIGPAPSAESYLRIDSIVNAALKTGADAVHPGYGFLAENADFADACAAAGLIFIGPSTEAIAAMGSKREAKALMEQAGVPVIPGYSGDDQDPAALAKHAKKVGFPVLLKASAGGGGKGMKLVRQAAELPDAIASAKREGKNAFGDDTLLVEKYIEQPRHVEIQILGDLHGNVVHLNERECSIQRRHQKIIEETPSPALDETLRAAMGEAAVRCAKAIGYSNAGTVEFVLAPDRSFYFLEVNTRLQVEHPITECVTGLDLVEQQLRVAQGEPLGFTQQEVRFEGAAIEVRLYAEDPGQGFLPQTGKLVDWHVPALEGLRVDSGVEQGTVVGVHYDPLLAKVITSGADRAEALQRMRTALRSLSAQGIRTNQAFLLRVLDDKAFVAGDFDTHFIETHMKNKLTVRIPDDAIRRAAYAATLADHERRKASRTLLPHVPSGWRNNFHIPQSVSYEAQDDTLEVRYRHLGAGKFRFFEAEASTECAVVSWNGTELVFDEDDRRRRVRVVEAAGVHHVHALEAVVSLHEIPRFAVGVADVVAGGCIAPMPGKVIELRVKEGDAVQAGQVLLVMEAMKMEHSVTAPADGVIEHVHVAAGDQVDADALLAVVVDG